MRKIKGQSSSIFFPTEPFSHRGSYPTQVYKKYMNYTMSFFTQYLIYHRSI